MSTGIEARGFIFGPPIALDIEAKFVPMRKPKKLPGNFLQLSLLSNEKGPLLFVVQWSIYYQRNAANEFLWLPYQVIHFKCGPKRSNFDSFWKSSVNAISPAAVRPHFIWPDIVCYIIHLAIAPQLSITWLRALCETQL